jgi:pyrimidine deaminase RibD-like protein
MPHAFVNARTLTRRRLLASLVLAPLGGGRAHAQTPAPRPAGVAQPPIPSRAAFLARARELRDAATAAGDQPYGAVLVRRGLVVGEGRSEVVSLVDPTAHSEVMAVRDAARRLGTRDLSDCDLYSSATPCPMCQGALYWAGVRRIHTDSLPEAGVAPKLGC